MDNLDLNIWSLFSGIGGLELGLERAKLGHTKLQCEIDPFAVSILNKHWPNVVVEKDVRQITKGSTNYVLPDLICGGFPCQPHSVAGKQKGANDDRHLWPEFARIINEFKPTYVVAENVPGIRTSGALREVLSDLADGGYDAEWIRVGAAAVGAPHLRERIFIVAYPGSARRQQISESASSDESQNAGRQENQNHVSNSNGESGGVGTSSEPLIFTSTQRGKLPITPDNTVWKSEPNVGRVGTGISQRVDRLRVLGNAVVPQVAQFVGECLYDAISEGRV